MLVGRGTMKEVTELIEALQARLRQVAGGGEILITHKTFSIKLGYKTDE